MGVLFWLRTVVLVIGGSVAAYGGFVLATGRVSHRSRAAFRSTRDAGMYSLCFGLCLVLLALGQFASRAESFSVVLTLSATVLAMVLLGLAIVRYRPRQPNSRR